MKLWPRCLFNVEYINFFFYCTCWIWTGSEQAANSLSKTWKAKSLVRRFWKQGDPEKRGDSGGEQGMKMELLFTVNNINAILWFWTVSPKEHLCEIMASSGSIHLTNVESLFITLNDSTRLRNTKKSASWDSTTLLFSTPKTTKTELFLKREGP